MTTTQLKVFDVETGLAAEPLWHGRNNRHLEAIHWWEQLGQHRQTLDVG